MENEIKVALRTKGLADAALVTLLGGNHLYEAVPQGSIDSLAAWITFWCASRAEDLETGRIDQVWQFDVWSRKSETGDAIAARVGAVYGWNQRSGGGTLPGLATRRLAEPIYEEPGPGETREDSGSGTLYHKVRQIRVATYPA